MILFRPTPYKESEKLDNEPYDFPSYLDARDFGDEFYESGYDIEEIDTDDMER